MKRSRFWMVSLAGILLSGCASDYAFRSQVPEQMRTVAVPTFRNGSTLTEIGPVATQQLLREFQREGTFKICSAGTAAVEVQGEILSVSFDSTTYNRRSGLRGSGGFLTMAAKISVIDKREGRVLVNDRAYTARVTLASSQDWDTALRDASGRVSDELARQIVDDILNLKW